MKHLIATAKELNNVLGIDPAIEVNPKKTNVETLEEKIKEAAELIEPETDEISVTTQQVLSELGVNPWDEEDGAETEEEDDADPEEVENDPESEEVEEVKKTAPAPKKVEKGNKPTEKLVTKKAEPKTKGELSNKAMVYLSWSKGQTDSAKLFTEIKEAVKETTVKSWIKSWEKGKNLPAIANK